VNKSLDINKLDGIWYEQAYIDFAQVGSRCQLLNATHDDKGTVRPPFFKQAA